MQAQGFPTETYLEEQPGAIWRKIRTSKWFKRCKWLAAQSLVLAVNIGQFELVSACFSHL